MPYGDRIQFRDRRSGRYRRPDKYEKNEFFEIDTLSKGLANFRFRNQNEMAGKAQDFAQELVQYARDNAPWEDQTGAAREGLTAEVTLENESLELTLSHTVEYGIWLEIRWGGRYAIIIPTIETMGPRIYEKMNNMFGEIVYYHDA